MKDVVSDNNKIIESKHQLGKLIRSPLSYEWQKINEVAVLQSFESN